MSEIEIRNLRKEFGDLVAVNDVSTTVEEGKLVTLLGPSGCGKTTTLRMIAGLETPTGGEIAVGGETLNDPGRNVTVAPEDRGMGMVFQSYAVWPHKTVFENVAYPLRIGGDTDNIKERVMNTLELVGIEDQAEKNPPQLSGGQQQRVAFARAVVYDPSVLLLDEPLSNLDAKLREHMRFELREFQQELGITTLYVTHNQSEAMVLSDEIIVMNNGEFVQRGSPTDIYNNPANQFVADFIGETNFLEATVVEAGADEVEVEIRGADATNDRLRITSVDPDVSVGDDVLLSIRPEKVVLEQSVGNVDANYLTGTVEMTTFLGRYLEAELDVGHEEVLTAAFRDNTVQQGDEVRVAIEPQDVHLITD